MTNAVPAVALIGKLVEIVGPRHVLTSRAQTQPFATGYRFGRGPVVAVVRPASLLEQWRAFVACIEHDHIVIVQAANTGLTGGSTPFGTYDRGVVVINTMRIGGIHLVRDGHQAICLSGATLHDLESRLAPLGREPHSVIGSSCVGASVVGGICNNSGGALIRRGPAYTECALFARVDASGAVHLENHLGLRLGTDPESILRRLERGDFTDADLTADDRPASGRGYDQRVRQIDSQTPARFNADPTWLFEAAGCAGRLMVLAVRVDTFPAEQRSAAFYIGTNDPADLTRLRRRMLGEFEHLPVAAEYMHRDAYRLAETYGKDSYLVIKWLGTRLLPRLFAVKQRFNQFVGRVPGVGPDFSERMLQFAARFWPSHLPRRMNEFRDQFEHHLILKVSDECIEPARSLVQQMFPSPEGAAFECTPEEAQSAFRHRFVMAGAAIRFQSIECNRVGDLIALDVSLRRDDTEWFERLPAEVGQQLEGAFYYGHFFCHVLHQDYVLRRGVDAESVKHRLLDLLAGRGAKYPAEHNVGHLYEAEPSLATHYRSLDPANALNPGIGRTSRNRGWA